MVRVALVNLVDIYTMNVSVSSLKNHVFRAHTKSQETEMALVVHEQTQDVIWHHNIRAHVSMIRTKAITISLINNNKYPYSKLNNMDTDLWDIAKIIDSDIEQLFLEIQRLKNKCGET